MENMNKIFVGIAPGIAKEIELTEPVSVSTALRYAQITDEPEDCTLLMGNQIITDREQLATTHIMLVKPGSMPSRKVVIKMIPGWIKHVYVSISTTVREAFDIAQREVGGQAIVLGGEWKVRENGQPIDQSALDQPFRGIELSVLKEVKAANDKPGLARTARTKTKAKAKAKAPCRKSKGSKVAKKTKTKAKTTKSSACLCG